MVLKIEQNDTTVLVEEIHIVHNRLDYKTYRMQIISVTFQAHVRSFYGKKKYNFGPV